MHRGRLGRNRQDRRVEKYDFTQAQSFVVGIGQGVPESHGLGTDENHLPATGKRKGTVRRGFRRSAYLSGWVC